MAKNFTELSPADITQILKAHFAGLGRRVTEVSYAASAQYDRDTNRATGCSEFDSARVTWDDVPPPEPNPRTA